MEYSEHRLFFKTKQGDYYIGDAQDDKPGKTGTIIKRYGTVYVGGVEDNKPHGKGLFLTPNGEIINGVWVDGKIDGPVVRMGQSGIYKGLVDGALPKGNGRLIQETSKYIGSFDKGLKNGEGVEYLWNGSRYEGKWENGVKHGKGVWYYDRGILKMEEVSYFNGVMGPRTKMFFYNNSTFEGLVKEENNVDYISGFGKYTLSPSLSFEGVHVNGKLEGLGTCTHNSNVYRGGFKNDLPHGKGTLKLANGFTIDAHYDLGYLQRVEASLNGVKYEVAGTKTFLTTKFFTYEGSIKDNKRVGPSKQLYKHADGSVIFSYEGSFKNDLKNGEGMFLDGQGAILYKGGFKKGAFHGNGVLSEFSIKLDLPVEYGGFKAVIVINECRYTGEFKKGKKCGIGKITRADGYSFEGQFKNDKPCGYGKLTLPDGTYVIDYVVPNLLVGYCAGGKEYPPFWTDYNPEYKYINIQATNMLGEYISQNKGDFETTGKLFSYITQFNAILDPIKMLSSFRFNHILINTYPEEKKRKLEDDHVSSSHPTKRARLNSL